MIRQSFENRKPIFQIEFETLKNDFWSKENSLQRSWVLEMFERGKKKELHDQWLKFVKDFQRNIRLLRDYQEITLNLELICGLPKETYNSFKTTINKAVSYKPSHISIYKLEVLEGSVIKNNTEKYRLKYKTEPPYTIIETSTMSMKEFNNLELLIFSNIVLYNTGIARLAMRTAAKRYKMTTAVSAGAVCPSARPRLLPFPWTIWTSRTKSSAGSALMWISPEPCLQVISITPFFLLQPG